MKKESYEDRFGEVLGRSWVVLGAVLGPWKRSRHYTCQCFVKIHAFQKSERRLRREHDFALQDGTQDDPKSTQDGSKTIFQAFFFRLRF